MSFSITPAFKYLRCGPLVIIIISIISLIPQEVTAQPILTQSFDLATFPPAGWTVLNSGPSWARLTAGVHPGCLPHSGAGMANFNSWYISGGTAELRTPALNFSTVGATYLVTFWMLRDNGFSSTPDDLSVYVNTTATSTGATLLGTIERSNSLAPVVTVPASGFQWYPYTFTVPTTFTGPTNYVIFKGTSFYGNDIFLDDVQVVMLPPCAGKPTAGSIVPVTPCPNVPFTLSMNGNQAVGGLAYQWQVQSGGGVWSNVLPGNTASIVQNISAATTYRGIVKCTVSGQSDTTAPYTVNLASFYYCYCNSGATFNSFTNNIGNVKVNSQPANTTLLNNGNAVPLNFNSTSTNTYTNFTGTVPPLQLYRDSLYKIFVTEINDQFFFQCTATAYIDYNRNGAFDNGEVLFSKVTSTANGQQVSDTFSVPGNAQVGLTGFRVLLVQTTGIINPCGSYDYGETEDYLANVRYAPCNGPASPGTAYASVDTVCVGYSVDLTDTTHETQRSGLTWVWETSSNNGASWTTVPGSTNKDTVNNVVVPGPSLYRLKMTCTNTGDNSYSNPASVAIGQAYQCYPLSQSGGGNADSSDIGAFTIGNYIIPLGLTAGPHLGNPLAVFRHTDNTQASKHIILYADSTYHVSVYHIMKGNNHADARVSLFLDYNNDLIYSPLSNVYPFSPERVFTGVTTAANYYVDSTITIPNAVIADVPTGLRVILNNDVNPTSAANLGAGKYVSGETEDYVVIFHRPAPAGVGQTGVIKDVILYPNPTQGRFTLDINSVKDLTHIDITVTTVTGQAVLSQSYEPKMTQFNTELDLTGKAKGIYIVTIRADGDKIVRRVMIQ